MKKIEKMFHVATTARGLVGKSTSIQRFVPYLKAYGVPVKILDTDESNRSSTQHFPDLCTPVTLSKYGHLMQMQSIDAVLQSVEESEEPVVIVDPAAEHVSLIQEAIIKVGWLTRAEELGIRMVCHVFKLEDTDVVKHLQKIVHTYGEKVNWVIWNNIKNTMSFDDYFMSSRTGRWVTAHGPTFTMDIMMPMVSLAIQAVETEAKRRLNLTELLSDSSPLEFHTKALLYEYAHSMYKQFDAAADVLVPPDIATQIHAANANAPVQEEAFVISDDDIDLNALKRKK
jgi:hypothetical protein